MTTQRLAPMDVASRLPRLRASLAERDVPALLVTRLPNVRYLTGFTGSAATLLVTAADALFVTDGRYRDRATDELAAAGVRAPVAIAPTVAAQQEILTEAVGGLERLGLEDQAVTWAQQRQLSEWFPTTELVPAGAVVEELRRVKDPGEVDRVRAACAIADDAFAALLPRLAAGVTELEFAVALEFAMRERGAERNSFDPIVAAGPNGAKPHAVPTARPVERGDLVVCDFGCVVEGYCSDMTRTVMVGDVGAEGRKIFDVVRASQHAGRHAVRAEVACADVDQASRAVIVDAGYGDAFLHSTGHGVGIEIHEAPRVSSVSRDTLLVGDIVTVEPGVYLTGVGGVRIEDTVVVTESGAEPLTLTPKDLVL